VKYFTWEDAKNKRLKAERGVDFEEIAFHIKRCNVLDTIERTNEGPHGHQRAFVLPRRDYVYLVPFVEDETSVFLETIVPRRRPTAPHPPEAPGLMMLEDNEQDIHDSFGRGEWRYIRATKQEGNRYARYARATFRKDRRLNIRISSRDLEAIQKRAIEEGLPYQTLIASVIHKFASGRLTEA
jgi:predicted DNA binding CopG/RHH family protein